MKPLRAVSSLHMDARDLLQLLDFRKEILGGKHSKPARGVGG